MAAAASDRATGSSADPVKAARGLHPKGLADYGVRPGSIGPRETQGEGSKQTDHDGDRAQADRIHQGR